MVACGIETQPWRAAAFASDIDGKHRRIELAQQSVEIAGETGAGMKGLGRRQGTPSEHGDGAAGHVDAGRGARGIHLADDLDFHATLQGRAILRQVVQLDAAAPVLQAGQSAARVMESDHAPELDGRGLAAGMLVHDAHFVDPGDGLGGHLAQAEGGAKPKQRQPGVHHRCNASREAASE